MLSPWTNTAIVFGVGVAVIVLTSCIGWIVFPNVAVKVSNLNCNQYCLVDDFCLISDVIIQNAILKEENADLWEAWITPPIPVITQFYLFNCTNCPLDRFRIDYGEGFKPNVNQIGPFSFT